MSKKKEEPEYVIKEVEVTPDWAFVLPFLLGLAVIIFLGWGAVQLVERNIKMHEQVNEIHTTLPKINDKLDQIKRVPVPAMDTGEDTNVVSGWTAVWPDDKGCVHVEEMRNLPDEPGCHPTYHTDGWWTCGCD